MYRNNSNISDVIILCGGKGTRLKEETEIKPKPMVEIGGRPILWHIMKYYASFGFRRFILALGYKGEYIKKYFYDYRFIYGDITLSLNPKTNPKFHSVSEEKDWEIVCVDTGLETLKGGRIKRLTPYLQSDIFHLTYGDGLSNVNLLDLETFHRSHGKVGTVTAVRPPSRFGKMVIEGDLVTDFEEKPQLKTGYINGGFFVFDRRFLDLISDDVHCDLEFGVLKRLARDRELMTFRHDDYWQCMDTRRDVDFLNRLWSLDEAPWKAW